MHPNINSTQSHPFNDYTIPHQTYKLLSSQDRSHSSNSIYYQQNSLSRKKLTVISRDNSRQDLKGDYLMTENGRQSHRNSQATDSLKSFSIHKSKLKRPTSPAPITPTKVIKLKKSLLSQNRQQSVSNLSQQRNSHHSITRNKFQTQFNSPIRFAIDTHRRMASTTSDTPIGYPIATSPTDNLVASMNLESMRREMSSLINLKVMEFHSRMKQQQQTIKMLESKLNDNQKKLKDKQHEISQLNMINRQRSNTFVVQSTQQKTKSLHNMDQQYILKRIKDIESKCSIFLNEQKNIQTHQLYLTNKLSTLQNFIITLQSSRLSHIKTSLGKFLQHKSGLLSQLSESVSYLDNKLIGRTQAIKETLCELKQKVKQVEDSWTHKDTKATKESTTLYIKQDIEQNNINVKNTIIHKISNKLREITSLDDVRQSITKPLIGSLKFSLTSNDDSSLKQNPKQHKNVYCEQNLHEMEDVSIALYEKVDDSSRLTDDFYYPAGNSTSRNLSPINNARQKTDEYYGQGNEANNAKKNLVRKQSPSLSIFKPPQTSLNSSPSPTLKPQLYQQSPSSPSKLIRISHHEITKKISSLKQLIHSKKSTSSESIQNGQLRCYVDKTGYLKYTDSKTFVFDKKGNLIPCSDGQFWFLVTKGLIEGKQQEEQSRTMSFIEVDE